VNNHPLGENLGKNSPTLVTLTGYNIALKVRRRTFMSYIICPMLSSFSHTFENPNKIKFLQFSP
jgi:hypothetical protein